MLTISLLAGLAMTANVLRICEVRQTINLNIYKPLRGVSCIYAVRHSLIIMSRRLTGKWYLKKKLFGFFVMVETIQTTICEFDFSTSPEFTRWEKAKESDFVELGINCA